MTSIEPGRKLIIGEHKQYPYDKAILAIGSVTTYFGIQGVAEHAYGIKSLAEIRTFQTHIHEEVVHNQLDKEFFIIGAGPTGVELAGALQEYLQSIIRVHNLKNAKPQVTVVEAAPRILPRMSKTAASKVLKRMQDMGIKVLTDHKVEALDDDHIVINGKKVHTKTAIWTSGVANNPFFAAHADLFHLAPNGRVNVDAHLEASKNIFVIGDNNTVKNSGVAWPALDQGTFVAKHIARLVTKQATPAYSPRTFLSGVPIGEDWGYVEKHGVYAAGKTGMRIRRWMELKGYEQLVPKRTAKNVWRAHYIPEIDA
jgi:NADH dehydrogenase FAD-containing subunit